MKVIVEESPKKLHTVEEGDLVWYKGSEMPGIVTTVFNSSDLVSINFDGVSRLNAPQSYVNKGTATLYKADEWEVVLRRKLNKRGEYIDIKSNI
jgi:hypothetical protein